MVNNRLLHPVHSLSFPVTTCKKIIGQEATDPVLRNKAICELSRSIRHDFSTPCGRFLQSPSLLPIQTKKPYSCCSALLNQPCVSTLVVWSWAQINFSSLFHSDIPLSHLAGMHKPFFLSWQQRTIIWEVENKGAYVKNNGVWAPLLFWGGKRNCTSNKEQSFWRREKESVFCF